MKGSTAPFSLEAVAQGTTFLLRLHGVVGEDFVVPTTNLALFKDIKMECASLRFINSRGLKQFINWLREVEASYPAMRVHMVDVSPTVNRQLISMLPFMAKNLLIDSLYLPFYCETCDHEDHKTRLTRDRLSGQRAPDVNGMDVQCASCGAKMDFDGNETKYFALMFDRRA